MLVKWEVSIPHVTWTLVDGLGDPQYLTGVQNVDGVLVRTFLVNTENNEYSSALMK